MGSEGNKMSDSTSFQPSETKLCANGCCFFGAATTMNLCSKCYRDFRIIEEHAASPKAAMDKLVDGFHVEIRAGSSSSAVEAAVELSATVVRAAGVESVNQAEHVFKIIKVFPNKRLSLPSIIMFQYNQALINMLHYPPHDSLILEKF